MLHTVGLFVFVLLANYTLVSGHKRIPAVVRALCFYCTPHGSPQK